MGTGSQTIWNNRQHFPVDKWPMFPYNMDNFRRKALKGTSSIRQKHTESSRLMRGAWKAGYEYILELLPQRCFRYRVGGDAVVGVTDTRVYGGGDLRRPGTYRDSRCEPVVNKGGKTSGSLVLFKDGLPSYFIETKEIQKCRFMTN